MLLVSLIIHQAYLNPSHQYLVLPVSCWLIIMTASHGTACGNVNFDYMIASRMLMASRNIYQYMVLEGASVTVYRNDEISLPVLICVNPTQLVISPGPVCWSQDCKACNSQRNWYGLQGHPDSDAGISKEAIKYFAGKIPVLGVCMGEWAFLWQRFVSTSW